jgi:hypothetical protein
VAYALVRAASTLVSMPELRAGLCGAAPCAATNELAVCCGASFSLQRRLQPSNIT